MLITPEKDALASLDDLKSTILNAIAEMELRAEQAAAEGDRLGREQYIAKAFDLARQAVSIREAEDKIRRSLPRPVTSRELASINADGLDMLDRLVRAVDAREGAAKLVGILARVSAFA